MQLQNGLFLQRVELGTDFRAIADARFEMAIKDAKKRLEQAAPDGIEFRGAFKNDPEFGKTITFKAKT